MGQASPRDVFDVSQKTPPVIDLCKLTLWSSMCSRAGAIFEEEGQAPANYLPMPKPTWSRITREFHVHREITRTILRDVACFSYLPHHDPDSHQLKLGDYSSHSQRRPKVLLSMAYN